MKYILIKGSRSSGKSATAKAICKRLNPTSVKRLCLDDAGRTILTPSALHEVEKDNYILTVKKRRILVVAGAPTGQRKKITDIMKAVHEADVYPDLSIVAVRGVEKLQDFATTKELLEFGECIHEARIWRIPSNNFFHTEEWDTRISHLTTLTLKNI